MHYPRDRNLLNKRSLATQSERSNSDVLGSYTGTPKDKDDDQPVQDADDL